MVPLLLFLPLVGLGADRDLAPAVHEQMVSERRVALVIGNGAYATGPLANPPSDAEAFAAVLRDLGFEVIARQDVTQKEMKRALIEFGDELSAGGVGLFYYAGHGMQVNGRNYLIPVDAVIEGEADVDIEGVDAGAVLAKMDNADNRLNLVILDACRNNPFERSFRSSGQGLAMLNAPSGTLVAYATAPGSVAVDTDSYTQTLLRHIKTEGLAIEDLFKAVRREVKAQTSAKQVPWESSSLEGDFYFMLPPEEGAESAAAPTRPSILAEHGYRMERIRPGSFEMGSPESEPSRSDDETQHTVEITQAFELGATEVTQGLFQSVMGRNPSAAGTRFWGGEARGTCSQWGVGQDLPVFCVDWMDAVLFANAVSEREGLEPAYTIQGDDVTWVRSADGYRLPTEAEWEYAARAGSSGRYAGTDEDGDVCRFSNVANPSTKEKYAAWLTWDVFGCTDGHDGLAEVGRLQPNAWGLHDMTGNVWEWTWDRYQSSGPPVDNAGVLGVSGSSERTSRGGSWGNAPYGVRLANRYASVPSRRSDDLGLRLARSPSPEHP